MLIVLCGVATSAADEPYIGRWKLNSDKSEVATVSLTIGDAGSGRMRATGALVANTTFALDGRDTPISGDSSTAWTRMRAREFRVIGKLNGAVATSDHITLSPDQQTLTIVRTVRRSRRQETFVLRRTHGDTGLIGTWEATQIQAGESVTEILSDGDDLTIHMFPADAVCRARFDGRDYPMTGPTVPNGVTLTLTRTGSSAFDVTQKQGGTPVVTISYRVSTDRLTLMTTTRVLGADGPGVSLTYDRQ